ncbi:serine hydrolase domain-containing protein [Ferruginibacter sp.]
MKKIFLVVCLFSLFSCDTNSQNSQQDKIEAVQKKVVKLFNEKNADGLYALTGAGFKKQLSEESFKNVAENNLFPLGEIKSAEFEKFEKGISKYKVTADAAILSMYLSLDSLDMIQTFLFQPYKKEVSGEFKKTVTDNKLVNALDKKVDSLLQKFMFESKTVGLSIGVLKNGKTYFYNYGETKKGKGVVPSSKNLYEIGSVTKTFTGLLLAKAVVEKKIALNDPVNKFLPKKIPLIKFGNDTLKIVHLANHTSGLPPLPDNFGAADLVNPYKDYDEKKLLEYLKHASLSRRPGEKFEYCNLAVGLLGNILEKVNKMSYQKMVTDFICSNAAMTATKQFLTKTDTAIFMQGYTESIIFQSQWDFKALAAAGSLRSNTEDMLKYAALNLGATNGKLNEAIELSHQPTFNAGQQKIGLNWFIQNWGWGEILFHGGQTGGYKSFLALNKKTKNAVIILANTGVNNDAAGIEILKYLDK